MRILRSCRTTSRCARVASAAVMLILAAITWVLGSPHAFAGVAVFGPNNNGCDTGAQTYVSTTIVFLGSNDFIQNDNNLATVDGVPVRVCYLSIQYQFTNTASPPTGNSQTPNQLTGPQLQNGLNNGLNPNPEITGQGATPGPIINSNLPSGCYVHGATPDGQGGCFLPRHSSEPAIGVRDSLEPSGIVLSADAPAFYSFEANAFSGTDYIPFVVTSSAPGDSLGIYGPGGVLWSQPLSDFDPDTLYFADIPGQTGTGPGAPIVLTYYINSDDGGSASVWFPSDLEVISSSSPGVPEPSTLGLMGLGLAAVGLFRRKRMQ